MANIYQQYVNSFVKSLTAVSTQVSSLSTTVNGLQTSVTAIQTAIDNLPEPTDHSQQLDDLATGLAAAQTAIASLTAQLENVSTAEDLAQISSTLANVEADVHELLEADAVINQDITIDNEATLIYAETLVGTKTDDPNVIVNGSVTVEITTTNFDAAQIARVNAITAKLATVLKAVKITNTSSPTIAVDLPNLTFVDNDYTVIGSLANDDALSSITGTLTIDHGGSADYSHLSNVRGNVIVDPAVTSLNLNTVTIDSNISSEGKAAGVLELAAATSIDVGTALVKTATFPLATSVDLGHEKAITTDVSISAPKANTLDFAASSVAGSFSISALASATVLNTPNLTMAGTTNIEVNTANLNSLKGFEGDAVISATTIGLNALSSNATGTLTINTAKVLNSPNFVITNTVTGTALTDVTIASSSEALLVTAAAKNITLNALANTTNFDASGYAALVSLNVTGKANSSPTAANVTSVVSATNTTLTSASVAGMIDRVVISDTSALTSFSTTGNIRIVSVHNADVLETLSIGHDHINGSSAAQIHITENAKIASFDLSSVGDVATLEIIDNALLTSFSPPSKTSITESVATIVATVTGNKLQGTYTKGIAVVPATATTPEVPAVQASLVQSSAYALRLWLEAHYSHTASPTYNIEIDALDSDADGSFDDGDYKTVSDADANNTAKDGVKQINITAELNTVKGE